MKKVLVIVILTFILTALLAEKNYSISGVNELEFIYRKMTENYEDTFDDEYKSNFSNKLQLQFQYKLFRVGLKYEYYHPKYDQFALTIYDTHDEKNENYFEEYYALFETDNWLIRAGTFDASIGSGMILNCFYNEDFDEDSSLIGLYTNAYFDKWQMQLFYGLMENESPVYEEKDKKDNVGAFDFEYNITEFLKLGTSYVMHQENQKLDFIDTTDAGEPKYSNKDFNQKDVISGRIKFQTDLFELSAEYADSKQYFFRNKEDIDGSALYSNFSLYLDKFTFSGAYKNYENFDDKISDLPTANHSEEPLYYSYTPGSDEEGMMGEIRFLPNYENEFVVNYSEGWTSDFSIRQSDLYSEFKHEFDFLTIKAEYEQLEQLDKNNTNWKKEITPVLTFDFIVKDMPVIIKTEYQYKEKEQGQEVESYYEPKLQTEIGYKDYSLSLIVETQAGDSHDAEDGDFWIGGEIAAYIFSCTDVRLFMGKEKAGKVCRNGVCKNQPEFEGVRLEITTFF